MSSFDKRLLVETLVYKGGAFVHVDPRKVPGTGLPAHLRDKRHIVLQYAHGMQIPMLEFVASPDELSAVLSFTGQSYTTRVPWDAVFAVADDAHDIRGYWAADMNPDIGEALATDQNPTKLRSKGHLTLLKGGKDPEPKWRGQTLLKT